MSWDSNDWKGVASAIARVAPALGTVIAGPVGAAVGTGVSILASTLGVEEQPEAIIKALSSDPQALIKVKQAEFDHEEKLQALVYETIKAGYANDAAIVESLSKADASGHSTRPKIALMMAWILVVPYTMIGVGIAYVIFNNPALVKDLWPVLAAYLGIPMTVLKMYFGDLRKEHAQSKGLSQPSILGSIFGVKK